jgi:hypothetical protein
LFAKAYIRKGETDMDKRLLIIALLFVSIVTTSNLALSATPWIYVPGDYAITGGTVKAALKVAIEGQKMFDITINLYNIGFLGDTVPVYFSFTPYAYWYPFEGDFSLKTSLDTDAKPLLTGYWWQKSSTAFAVDADLVTFYDNLMGSLGSMNISVDRGNATKKSFTGTISKDALTIKGKYALTVPFAGITTGQTGGVDLSGTSLTISGSYVAQYTVPPTLTASHTPSVSLAQESPKAADLTKAFAEIIREKIVSAIQKK